MNMNDLKLKSRMDFVIFGLVVFVYNANRIESMVSKDRLMKVAGCITTHEHLKYKGNLLLFQIT